jgi:hypothetical protein
MNSAFQRYKAGVVYSNFIFNFHYRIAERGFTSRHTDQEIKDNLFREANRASHLIGWRTSLFKKIKI